MLYSLRPIIVFANIDVSRHILVVDTSVLAKSNMGRREYGIYPIYKRLTYAVLVIKHCFIKCQIVTLAF
jgi:hypothetical protein